MSKDLKFVFFGTPNVASETLEVLKNSGYTPALIVTSPDRPAGRKMLLTPPPAKVWAEANKIPYIQPEKVADLPLHLSKERFNSPDIFLVVAYGKIIPENILNIPSLGSFNIHYSLLPKYRGASPVESAVLNGDTVTGVTIQKMVYKLDAGPVVAREEVEILPDETTPELRKRLIKIGADLLVKVLPDIVKGKIKEVTQDESLATHCGKLNKEDGLLDLATEPSTVLYNKFRAYATWPRTYFFKDSKRYIITEATLEGGKFIIKKVIPEGGKEIEYRG